MNQPPSFTHLPTHPPIHSLTHARTNSHTHSFIHLFLCSARCAHSYCYEACSLSLPSPSSLCIPQLPNHIPQPPQPKPSSPQVVPDSASVARWSDLTAYLHAASPPVKVLYSIYPNRYGNYAAMAASASSRATFIASAVATARR